MDAQVLVKQGKDFVLQLEKLRMPTPGKGEVLIRTKAYTAPTPSPPITFHTPLATAHSHTRSYHRTALTGQLRRCAAVGSVSGPLPRTIPAGVRRRRSYLCLL